MRRRAAVPLLAASLTVHATQAHAGASDTVGLGPREMAIGNSSTAQPSNHAAYYNPATIPFDAEGPAEGTEDGIEIAFVYAHPMMYARRRSDGVSLPLADDPHDTVGVSVGSRLDLGSVVGVEGLGLALSVYVPGDDIFRWSIHPDESVQWLFLTDRTDHLGIHLGLAYRPMPWARWLSMGVGLRVLFDAETLTTGRVEKVTSTKDPDTGETKLDVTTQLGEEVRVVTRVAPVAGVMLQPMEELSIGLVYRGKISVDDWGWTRVQGVPGSGDLGYVHRFNHYFSPHTLELGVSARIHPELILHGSLAYGRWRDALTTNAAELGPGRFGDTFTPSLGVSWRPVDPLELRAGYRYVRSPFDNLGGPTNLLDNDQHVVSGGAALALGEVPDSNVTITLAWGLRAALHVERIEDKDPRRFTSDRQFVRNPGRESYRYGGAVPGGSASLEASW